MGGTLLETLSIVVLSLALVPLGLFMFYYSTHPVAGSRWRRKFAPVWASSFVGWWVMSTMTALFLMLGYVLLVRFIGDFPGRVVVSFVLFVALMGTFWGALAALRAVQRPDEKETRSGLRVHDREDPGEDGDDR